MNSFIYDIPTKVYFGKDQLGNLGKEVEKYGKRVLLTYGGGSIKKTGLYDKVMAELNKIGAEVFELSGISPNPRVESVREGAEICKKNNVDLILAVGGGSVLDCSKFIGAATFYDGDAWDISIGKVDVEKCLPLITILTLSATGSEMDCGGVITNEATQDKVGRMCKSMQPKVSFLDPTNTYTVSAYQTACGAADILSHIFEEYFNLNKDLEMLDGFMEVLIKTVIKYTPIAIKEPTNYEARANIMWASSWAINGFIVGGKRQNWSCHPMEHQLSAVYDITHGLGLAILTPRWMRYSLSEKTVDRFYRFATNVFGLTGEDKMAVSVKGIEKLEEFLFKTIGLTDTLSKLGIDDKYFDVMAEKAASENTFTPLTKEDVKKIYEMCL